MEFLGQQGLRGFRAEVAQEHHQGITPGSPDIRNGLGRVLLVLYRDPALVNLPGIGGNDILPALGTQGNGETVAGNRDNTKFDFRNVVHRISLP